MRLVLVAFSLLVLRAEIKDVIKSAEIDKMLARTTRKQALHVRPNYAVWLKVHDGRPGPYETHADADDMLHVRRGQATLRLGEKRYQVGAGDIIHIPRNTPHQIDQIGRASCRERV